MESKLQQAVGDFANSQESLKATLILVEMEKSLAEATATQAQQEKARAVSEAEVGACIFFGWG